MSLDRPHYVIFKTRADGHWNLERLRPDGSVTPLGKSATRRAVFNAAALLAGWRGIITIEKGAR